MNPICKTSNSHRRNITSSISHCFFVFPRRRLLMCTEVHTIEPLLQVGCTGQRCHASTSQRDCSQNISSVVSASSTILQFSSKYYSKSKVFSAVRCLRNCIYFICHINFNCLQRAEKLSSGATGTPTCLGLNHVRALYTLCPLLVLSPN